MPVSHGSKVWEGWQSVRWKSSRKWARFWTAHRTRGDSRFSRRPFFASLATALSYSSISQRISRGSGCILALCLRFSFRVSLLRSSVFLAYQMLQMSHPIKKVGLTLWVYVKIKWTIMSQLMLDLPPALYTTLYMLLTESGILSWTFWSWF